MKIRRRFTTSHQRNNFLKWTTTLAFFASLLSAVPHAHARTAVRNDTPNPIRLLYSFSSVSGIGCGYDDGCDDDTAGTRVMGWFIVRPGQSLTLNSRGHHNASHSVYAEDDYGHSWAGSIENLDSAGIPGFPYPQSIDACFHIPPDIAGSIMYSGFMMWPAPEVGACCGEWCSPEDYEEVLSLDAADAHLQRSEESLR